jgi:hypothetical protein
MSQNRPVAIRGAAKSWNANKKWADKEYLTNLGGYSTSEVSHIQYKGTKLSEYEAVPRRSVMMFSEVIKGIQDNEDTKKLQFREVKKAENETESKSAGPRGPYVSYIENQLLSPSFRNDFELIYLHRFLSY